MLENRYNVGASYVLQVVPGVLQCASAPRLLSEALCSTFVKRLDAGFYYFFSCES